MSPNQLKTCLAFQCHDHQRCQRQLLSAAKNLCTERNSWLTARREQVLEILSRSHQPLGGYAILEQINQQESHPAVAPTIVYRALDFLLKEGLIHRIECKNAFTPCTHPGHCHAAHFLICKGCEKVAEIDNPTTALQKLANRVGFTIDHSVVEVTGFCADCQQHVNC